jgi:hypothetical protein
VDVDLCRERIDLVVGELARITPHGFLGDRGLGATGPLRFVPPGLWGVHRLWRCLVVANGGGSFEVFFHGLFPAKTQLTESSART